MRKPNFKIVDGRAFINKPKQEAPKQREPFLTVESNVFHSPQPTMPKPKVCCVNCEQLRVHKLSPFKSGHVCDYNDEYVKA